MVNDDELTALIEAGNATEAVQTAIWLDAEAQHNAEHSDEDSPLLTTVMEGQRAIEQYQRDVARETEGMDQDQLNEWTAEMDAYRAAVAEDAAAQG